ncbi:MAG: RNA polymerase sigma factor [Planctomycetaceae bacterium]
MDSLPSKYQESVVLCYLEGHTQEEAAEELGLTASAIKARLARGRKLLKRNLIKRGVELTAVLALWNSSNVFAASTISGQLVEQVVGTMSVTDFFQCRYNSRSTSLNKTYQGGCLDDCLEEHKSCEWSCSVTGWNRSGIVFKWRF